MTDVLTNQKGCLLLLFIISCNVAGIVLASNQTDVMNVTIVKADSTEWLADHAISELDRYLKQMTSCNIQVAEASSQKESSFFLQANLPDTNSSKPKSDIKYIFSLGGAEADKLNESQCEEDIKRAGKVIDSMGKYIQAICLVGDLGTQAGPFCRPSDYERVSAPFLKKICTFIHKNNDLKIFYHCCGSINSLIPILIDCGVDVLNPIQISANNMDPAELQKEFGGKIAFWGGGCDTQRVLSTGTPQMVSDNVRQLVGIFKKNPGYVFNQVHNIMGNVPPENIVAMLDTAYECSFN